MIYVNIFLVISGYTDAVLVWADRYSFWMRAPCLKRWFLIAWTVEGLATDWYLRMTI